MGSCLGPLAVHTLGERNEWMAWGLARHSRAALHFRLLVSVPSTERAPLSTQELEARKRKKEEEKRKLEEEDNPDDEIARLMGWKE